MIALVLGVALAGDLPTLGAWQTTLGEPGTAIAASAAARAPDEPLLLYWMQVRARPLGVGPELPGTLVANFDATEPVGDSVLRDFTFLAVAGADDIAALHAAVAPWVVGDAIVERPAGPFRVLDLALPDGRKGSVSIRQGAATGSLADGRPSPSLWMFVGPG